MTKDDPFGFDMSVSSAKKKKTRGRRGMSGAFETSTRRCDHEGCQETGQYRAPKSPDHLDEFYWFCKDHVREYNLKWNFFNGSTEEEFNDQIDSDRVWGRETKPFRRSAEERAWARLGVDDPHQVLGDNATRNPGKSVSGTRRLPPTERRALEILEAKDHWTRSDIRKAYRSLIKILHPDMNGGDRSDEERLQEVVWAWDQIKDSRSFKD
ncbi:J domain-containing protein [Qingshengfaniella alkalisoli]|uniref:J domain-containing protein n=1 Tax=Qingshengfaniella alkalisoli TaxID=2599296 RepID=A0A5B8J4H8_9RHOB|nr:J domain-containing protein [Qingshengfaniella alkalisoli]QDY69437.1 J domain-containing protein [Qingshengfaniella alkalisoli]